MLLASVTLFACFARANAQATVGTCPAGQTAIAEVGFAISGFENNRSDLTSPPIETEAMQLRPILAGPIQPAGTLNSPNGPFTIETFFNSIDLHLTALTDPVVPEDSQITLSLAQVPFNNGLAEVLTSNDGTTFASVGTIGFGSTPGTLGNVASPPDPAAQDQNPIRHITFQVPAGSGGARFVRVDQIDRGFRVDGVQRNEICSAGPAGPPAVVAVDDIAAALAGTADVINVAANDTLGGAAFPLPNAAGSTTDIQIAPGSSVPPELVFDPATGDVSIAPGAPDGLYQFSYEICETAAQTNCAIADVEITVSSAPIGATCPAGQTPISIPSPLPATAGFETNGNDTSPPPIGSGTANTTLSDTILAAGTVITGFPGSEAVASFFDSIDFDLTGDATILIPEGAVITLAVAEFPGAPQFPITTVLTSPTANLADATTIGTLGFGGTTGTLLTTLGVNTVVSGVPPDAVGTSLIRHVEITVPAGGARFVRIDLTGFGSPNGFQVRGAQYQDACQVNPVGTPELIGSKTVEAFEPGAFSIPGNDVVYTITIENTGNVDIDNDTIVLFDPVPPEVSFVNLPFSVFGGGILAPDPVFFSQMGASLDFQFARDVGFSSSPTPPTDFSQCTDALSGEVNPQVNFICLNPKGVFAANPAGAVVPKISFQFRMRIN